MKCPMCSTGTMQIRDSYDGLFLICSAAECGEWMDISELPDSTLQDAVDAHEQPPEWNEAYRQKSIRDAER